MNCNFNSVGAGKGIVTFFTDKYWSTLEITENKYQMSKICSEKIDVINIYRSDGASTEDFLFDLISMIDTTKITLIVGDLNICGKTEANSRIIRAFYEFGFRQQVKNPTHMEGRQIDHVFLYTPENCFEYSVTVHQSCPYFTDHDLLFITEVRISLIELIITYHIKD